MFAATTLEAEAAGLPNYASRHLMQNILKESSRGCDLHLVCFKNT